MIIPNMFANPQGVGQAVPDKHPENVRHSPTYTEFNRSWGIGLEQKNNI